MSEVCFAFLTLFRTQIVEQSRMEDEINYITSLSPQVPRRSYSIYFIPRCTLSTTMIVSLYVLSLHLNNLIHLFLKFYRPYLKWYNFIQGFIVYFQFLKFHRIRPYLKWYNFIRGFIVDFYRLSGNNLNIQNKMYLP